MINNSKNGPRFYLCSFQNTITSFMNPSMAIQLYVMIESVPGASKELFAFKEKLRTQLFHLNKTKELEDALSAFNLGTNESGSGDLAAAIAAGVSPISDQALAVS